MRYATPATPVRHWARLRPVNGAALALESSFDADFVAAFKSQIPAAMRRWDKERRRWQIDLAYAQHVADLCRQYLGVEVQVPAVQTPVATLETRLIELRYLGRTKERGTGERLAYGWADGGWTVLIPEQALRDWFGIGPAQPGAGSGHAITLYEVLLVTPKTTLDEIKAAFRRLARTTHPDVNHEPDAAEQFRRLKEAYDVLSDALLRRKYDAGLSFESHANAQQVSLPRRDDSEYRSPIRCGYLLVEGTQALGGFVVSRILQWESIVNDAGQELVSSWPAGTESPVEEWI